MLKPVRSSARLRTWTLLLLTVKQKRSYSKTTSSRSTNRVTTWSCVMINLIPLSSYQTTSIRGFLSIAVHKKRKANILVLILVPGLSGKVCAQCSVYSLSDSVRIATIVREAGLASSIKCSGVARLVLKAM